MTTHYENNYRYNPDLYDSKKNPKFYKLKWVYNIHTIFNSSCISHGSMYNYYSTGEFHIV